LQHEKAWTAALNKTERERLTDGLAQFLKHLRETECCDVRHPRRSLSRDVAL
jgi:hypothetical protein